MQTVWVVLQFTKVWKKIGGADFEKLRIIPQRLIFFFLVVKSRTGIYGDLYCVWVLTGTFE